MDERGGRDPAPESSPFVGSPATRALLSGVDWAATALGPVEGWPEELCAAMRTVLPSEVPMLLWWGPDLVQVYNQAYVPFLGSKHPAQGVPAAECWAEVWDDLRALVDSVWAGEGATHAEDLQLFLDRHVPQEETYWTFSYSPIHDTEGEVVGIFVATTDTTRRVVDERRLRVLRELGALSAADAGGAEAVCRAAMEVLERKPGVHWAAAYVLDEPATVARWSGGFGVAVEGEDRPRDLRAPSFGLPEIGRALATGRPQEVRDLGARHPGLRFAEAPDVESRSVAMALPLVPGETAAPLGVLVLGSSPHRVFDEEYRAFFELVGRQVAILVADAHAYQAAHRRAHVLEEADRAKTRFLQNVSHELRTPLTLVLGPLGDLLRSADAEVPATAREGMEAAHRAARRLERMVDALLEVARGAAGEVEARVEPTDLAALTTGCADMFRPQAEAAGLALEVDVAPLEAPVLVDREMWTRVVLNLVANAVKFTPAGRIGVTLRRERGEVELEVTDTGIGIAEDEQPRVFERFHQVPGARPRAQEGVGIGLSLVADLVHAHGGTVEVESALGAGSTFRVRVPLRLAPGAPVRPLALLDGEVPAVAPAPDEAPAPPAPSPAEGRVLLVEDDTEMRTYLRRLLTDAGWAVDAVGDVDAAVAVEPAPDIVVSDVMLPGRDGLDLVRELRADPARALVPVILVTARAGPGSAVDGLSAGADDYVVKPFEPHELVARVQVHLELSRLRAYAMAQAEDEAANLRVALASNRQIGAAVGILMQQRLLTADDAFAELRRVSQHTNRKLRDVAAELVETGSLPDAPLRGAPG